MSNSPTNEIEYPPKVIVKKKISLETKITAILLFFYVLPPLYTLRTQYNT